MEKLLAALSLPQVGAIKLIPKDKDPEGKEGLFALELNSRMYTLRARDDEEASRWVTALTTLRQQGIAAAAKEADSRPTTTRLTRSVEMSGSASDVGLDNNAEASWIKSTKTCWCC